MYTVLIVILLLQPLKMVEFVAFVAKSKTDSDAVSD